MGYYEDCGIQPYSASPGFILALTTLAASAQSVYTDLDTAKKGYNLVMRLMHDMTDDEWHIVVPLREAVLNSIQLIRLQDSQIRTREKRMGDGIVYFLLNSEETLMKIGFTTDKKARMATLQAVSPSKLWLIKEIEGTLKDEMALHQKFKHLKDHCEWFRYTKELQDFVSNL